MGDLPAFPKPYQAEGLVELSPRELAAKRLELFRSQCGWCAECGQRMVIACGSINSCTVDHIIPNKMGCKKRSNDDNLQALCFQCNSKKGSRRLNAKGK